MGNSKEKPENVEHVSSGREGDVPTKSLAPIMRSREDDLGIWQCVLRFKNVSLIAMAAAFSASLDGYRRSLRDDKAPEMRTDRNQAEINLNGGIVSNKGFIRQMASPGTSIIAGKYISAWGGIQSAGQTVGQIV